LPLKVIGIGRKAPLEKRHDYWSIGRKSKRKITPYVKYENSKGRRGKRGKRKREGPIVESNAWNKGKGERKGAKQHRKGNGEWVLVQGKGGGRIGAYQVIE